MTQSSVSVGRIKTRPILPPCRRSPVKRSKRGCQILLLHRYQNGKNIPNNHTYNIPNSHNVYVPNYSKIGQRATKYTNIFHCNTLQNLPKLWFENMPSGNPGSLAKMTSSDLFGPQASESACPCCYSSSSRCPFYETPFWGRFHETVSAEIYGLNV
jgi:hypothetical protein